MKIAITKETVACSSSSLGFIWWTGTKNYAPREQNMQLQAPKPLSVLKSWAGIGHLMPILVNPNFKFNSLRFDVLVLQWSFPCWISSSPVLMTQSMVIQHQNMIFECKTFLKKHIHALCKPLCQHLPHCMLFISGHYYHFGHWKIILWHTRFIKI